MLKKIVDVLKTGLLWVLVIIILVPLLAITPTLKIIYKKVFNPIFVFFSNYGLLFFNIIVWFFLGLYFCQLAIDEFIKTDRGASIAYLVYITIAFCIAVFNFRKRNTELANKKADLEFATPIILEQLSQGKLASERFKYSGYYDRQLIADIIYNEWCRLFDAKNDGEETVDHEWFELLEKELNSINQIMKKDSSLN